MSVSNKEVDRASSNVLETSAESEQANYWLDLISTNSTKTSSSFRDAKWVSPGEHIEIAGFDINCGMIYVGRHLPDDHHMSEDPCLINPTLKVNRVCFNRTGKCKGPGTSYQKMSATRKSAYLEWLSDGRCSAKAYTGFVFQFLYGLEYRVLRELKECRSNDGVVSELTQIREEVARLQSIYGDASTSFKEYASRFLDICDLLRKSDSVYKAEPSLSENLWDTEPCWHFRLRLKVTLAQIAKEKQPVPIDWLFAWWFNAKRARQSYLYNTEKFRGLIRQKYEEKYGEGIVIELGTDPLRVSYRTANSGFSHSEACLTIQGLTDVSFSEQTFHAIQVLVDECTLEAETYIKKESYYKGSNKEASIEKVKEDIPGLQQWLRKIVGRKHCANVSVRVLLEKCSMPNFQSISNYRLVDVCQALETLGYGIEPDILSKRKELKEDSHVALFSLSGKNKALPPKEFIVATLLPGCINEILSEGNSVYSSAQSLLEDQIQESEGCLSVSEWRRLTINLQSQEKDKTKLLSMGLYEKIGTKSFLCDSINNYGLVDENYALLIDEICFFLNLLQDDIDSYFHCQNVEEDDDASGVVEKKSFCLDMTVVRQKQSESIRVDKLLGDVFEEDEPTLCEAPDYPESPKLLYDMPLDSNHFQLLHLISQRKLWHRTELESKANDLGLLLDGALETINDVAFDFFDEAATDGKDPIEVDIEIVEPLLDQMKTSY